MLELIPVIGPVLSQILGWPVKTVLTLPATEAVEVIRTSCQWLIGGGCA